MGSRRFELLTSAMSRRRHNQLDHEPLKAKCSLNMSHLIIKELLFGPEHYEPHARYIKAVKKLTSDIHANIRVLRILP